MQIPVQPHVLKDIVLTIGVDDYAAHVSSAKLTPSTDTPKVTWTGLTPTAKFSESGNSVTSWVFAINSAQDWETANSLSQYLFNNAGQVKTVVLTPQKGSGKTFEFDVTIVPGEIGGDVNTVAVAPVTMNVNGTPAMTNTVVV